MEELNVNEIDISTRNLSPFSFANVKKETAGETFKHWNKLLKSQTVENIENFKEIISPSVPLSAFEEKLRLIAVDTFQLKDEVINILLSQNDFSIKRVLKCKWFFQNLSAEFCIQELFPRVSYCVRLKLINKLSRNLENKEEAEKLFSFLESNFVGDGAEILLPKCSTAFILNYCKNVKPLVTHLNWKRIRILKKICERFPDLGVHILELNLEYEKKHDINKLEGCSDTMRYLAGNHMNSFLPFFKKNCDEFNIYISIFGKNQSWKIVKKEKDFFFQSRLLNTNILNKKHIFLMLDTNDKIKCIATLVSMVEEKLTLKSWISATSQITAWISVLPPEDRYSIITTAFKKLYNSDIQDQPKCWTYELLELIPPKERQSFAEKMEKIFLSSEDEFRETLSDNFYYDHKTIEKAIYLYEFPTAFVKFKSIIKKTPITNRREEIILYMLKCCKINNDTKGLEEVLDYVSEYHRHESRNVIFSFAHNICSLFPSLPSNINQKLKSLLLFCFAKGSFDSYSFTFLTEREIYQSLESNKDTDDLVKKFFEVILQFGNFRPFLSHYHSKHTRTLLLMMGKLIREWIQNHLTDPNCEWMHAALIATCLQFNKVHENNKVALTEIPEYVEVLKELYKNKYKHNKLGVEDWPVEILKTCDMPALNLNSLSRLFCHFLKTRSELIMNHLEAVLDHSDSRFYSILVKHVTFLGEREKLKEITLNKFQKSDSFEKRRNALTMYSHVCTIEEFTDAVQQYIPQEDHVKGGDSQEFAEMQLMVPRVIKHVRPRWKNLNLILKFYRGDFLKQVMFSFFATCFHSRVDFILLFLREFIFKIPPKVSYTKNIIRIIFTLSSQSETLNFCLKSWQDNKHYSIRKIIFQHLIKLFLKNPSRELFNVIVNCVLESEQVVLEDDNLDRMKMPKEFVGEYALALWKASKNFTLKEDFRRVMFWSINLKNIHLFPLEFCEEVLREYLFHPKQVINVRQFAAFYCGAGQGAAESRIRVILKLMQETKANVDTVRPFLYELRKESHSSPEKFGVAMSILLKNWPDSLSIYLEKYIYVYYNELYKILQTSKEPSVVSFEFGKVIRGILSGVNDLNDLTDIISDTLKEFLSEMHGTTLPIHPLIFCRELLGNSPNKTIAMIAVRALPSFLGNKYAIGDASDNSDADKRILNEIFRVLENMNNYILWVYFWRIFKENKPVKLVENILEIFMKS